MRKFPNIGELIMLRRLRTLFRIPKDLFQMLCVYFPGPIGFKLRYAFYRGKLKLLGKNVRIDVGTYFQNPEYVAIDDHVWIDRNVIILAGPPDPKRITYSKTNPDFRGKIGEVYIGKFTHIAPNCVLSGMGGLQIGKNCGVASNSTIYSFSHHYRNLTNSEDTWHYSFTPLARHDQQSMILGSVVIEDFCAVGLNSTILPGTTLKKGTWIGSGTVVSGRYPRQTLVISNSSENKQKSLSYLRIRE
jgi:acetyltransferase-like isoleucine patch superfamily enzyme